ncbi:MAG: TetR/AcrR family transcriptional regulator [Spirochaetaceae bacterium]|nr:TetR/AcrR family transcriptional regulator [Spirochaetaceae bacterium]
MKEAARKARSNREKIIQAAAKLIIEKGVANTSLADIAGEVGISKGTLYYYYATKGDLIFDISVRHMEHITNTIIAWINGHGRDREPESVLQMVIETVLKSETRGYIHFYLIQEALSGNHESLKIRFTEEYDRWLGLIEQGLRLILPTDTDFKTISRVLLSAIDGLLVQNLLGQGPLPLREISRFFAYYEGELTRPVSSYTRTQS